jgi:membrane-associated protease RseP (regulator of RpoE activity)
LIVAIPIIWIGARELNVQNAQPAGLAIELPLAMRLAVDYLHPGAYKPGVGVPISELNPYFMAGWVGLLVTGLNMLPVSQLDGGHVTYALFGRGAHWLARIFMLLVFVYMGLMYAMYQASPTWLPMALLVLLLGTDHPPTRDDTVRLGWFRGLLGVVSLLIPLFCFTPNPLH